MFIFVFLYRTNTSFLKLIMPKIMQPTFTVNL